MSDKISKRLLFAGCVVIFFGGLALSFWLWVEFIQWAAGSC